MKKVVLFVRVSTQKQEFESQVETLKRNALVDGYGDDDLIIIAKKESGVNLKEAEREGLNELKAVIEENEIDCVYIYELSRLSRDPMTLYSIRDNIFKNNRVQLKCLKPAFLLLEEPDRTKIDSMGSLVFSIFGCFAEQEAVEKKERFFRGKSQNAKEGKYNGGVIPYGYELDPDHGNIFVVNPEEAANIHTIYDLYESGYSISRVVEELHERGLKYRSYRSNTKGLMKEFDVHFVHHLLQAELLTGKKVNKSYTSHEHSYPPIISEAQFERCRDIAHSRNAVYGKTANVYLAKSLLICPDCGSPYIAFTSSISYVCGNAIMPEKWKKIRGFNRLCSNHLFISINALDSLLWHITIDKECEYLLGTAHKDKTHYEEQIASLEEKLIAVTPRLDEIEEKRSRIIDSYIDGEITKNEKIKKSEDLDSQKLDILQKKVEYEQKIEYYRSCIDDINRLYSLEGLDSTGICDDIHDLFKVRERIESITDDEERYRLVHKHIKQLTIEGRFIRDESNTKPITRYNARYLTVTFMDGTIQYYYFMSAVARGGRWLYSDAEGHVLDNVEMTIDHRYTVSRKKPYVEKQRAKKQQEFEKKYPKDRHFLFTIGEMSEYLCMSRNTVIRCCDEGFFQDALTIHGCRTRILDADRALEIMRASDLPYFKRVVKKFDMKHKKED